MTRCTQYRTGSGSDRVVSEMLNYTEMCVDPATTRVGRREQRRALAQVMTKCRAQYRTGSGSDRVVSEMFNCADRVDAHFSVVEHLGTNPVDTAPGSVLKALLTILLVLLSNACTSSDSATKLEKETNTIISWAATAQMVGEAWHAASVPRAYADRTLQSAQEAIEKEKRAIQTLSISPDTRSRLSGNIESVGTA